METVPSSETLRKDSQHFDQLRDGLEEWASRLCAADAWLLHDAFELIAGIY